MKLLTINLFSLLPQIDRLFQWKTSPQTDVSVTIKKQNTNTKVEFEERSKESILQISEQVGL